MDTYVGEKEKWGLGTIVNSLFKKKEEHFVTFRSGSCKTQIDYFLIRANHKRLCKDCKVIPS